jgi:hypothetical protein
MDFLLSEKHTMLQGKVLEFARDKVAPVADTYDRTQEFPFDNFRAMGRPAFRRSFSTKLPTPWDYQRTPSSSIPSSAASRHSAQPTRRP